MCVCVCCEWLFILSYDKGNAGGEEMKLRKKEQMQKKKNSNRKRTYEEQCWPDDEQLVRLTAFVGYN